jgi:hypothetical protein
MVEHLRIENGSLRRNSPQLRERISELIGRFARLSRRQAARPFDTPLFRDLDRLHRSLELDRQIAPAEVEQIELELNEFSRKKRLAPVERKVAADLGHELAAFKHDVVKHNDHLSQPAITIRPTVELKLARLNYRLPLDKLGGPPLEAKLPPREITVAIQLVGNSPSGEAAASLPLKQATDQLIDQVFRRTEQFGQFARNKIERAASAVKARIDQIGNELTEKIRALAARNKELNPTNLAN